ncbi:MAG TPA: hypothetical protein VLA54_11895 [Acidimicrobiia bacterium]|nr:hypothetical protein [Acidimicrobiia bacterium]
MKFQKKLAVGAALATLSLVVAAVVFAPVMAGAQETTTTDEVAESESVYRGDRIRAALDDLVEAGTITAAQADAVAEHLATTFPHHGLPHHGLPAHGRHFLGRGMAWAGLNEIAAVIGVDLTDLTEALRDGQSIADVATTNGVDPEDVIDALVQAHQDRLDQAVGAGRITAEEAGDRAARARSHITDLVNGEFAFRPGFLVRPARDADA